MHMLSGVLDFRPIESIKAVQLKGFEPQACLPQVSSVQTATVVLNTRLLFASTPSIAINVRLHLAVLFAASQRFASFVPSSH